jgi:hypothetical protein
VRCGFVAFVPPNESTPVNLPDRVDDTEGRTVRYGDNPAHSSIASHTRCVIAAGTSSMAKVTVRWKPPPPAERTTPGMPLKG